ncbi:hypothetical protein J2W97_003469 [Paenibacillus jamilae]|jgi:hypothetical protein|nr:hypothetical protein [Paenibacillus jamilae]PTU47574.1 hypothetical protein DBL67_07440 [Paenibacillus polymyxa]QDA27247.1 hypothetical protein FGY93_10015 [Paenibacillus polymyxa]RTZ34555.1 hypothetical protein EJ573_14005 [Paenibacillus polymyxa]SPY23516.1 Uncharacterised protein [Paenibacillus polymyxa]
MRTLWIFILFMLLMLGTSVSIKWLFGIHHPWEPVSLAFRTMRPSEYIVLVGMLMVLLINVGKKPIGNAFRFLFSQWSRFLKVSTSSSASPQESQQEEQTRNNVNK